MPQTTKRAPSSSSQGSSTPVQILHYKKTIENKMSLITTTTRRQNNGRSSLRLVLLLSLSLLHGTFAFLQSPSSPRSCWVSRTSSFMVGPTKRAGGGGGGSGSGSGTPSPGAPKKNQRKYANPKLDRNKSPEAGGPDTKRKLASSSSNIKKSSSSSSGSSGSSGTKKPKSMAPPWQVVSQKDMAKNVQAELDRRSQAQDGHHQTLEQVQKERQSTLGLTRSLSFVDPIDKSIMAWKRFATPFSNSNTQKDDIQFMGAFLDKRLPPRLGVPEIAFLGRSNVGKSSLLNKLVHSDSARVGKTPGATASVNLYAMMRGNKPVLGLVDLPGFGYAKLSKESKESVERAAENYLGRRKELFLGILLVDIRRVPSEDDRAVLAALFDMGLPIVVVATKADKLSSDDKIDMALETIRSSLGLPEGQPLCISSVTGMGMKDMWQIIMEGCEAGVAEYREKYETGGTSSSQGEDDEDGELLSEEDDDEVAYNQGFDWIRDSAVSYEGDDDDDDYDDDDEDFEEDGDDNEKRTFQSQPEAADQTLKFLRKKVKDMERKGEI